MEEIMQFLIKFNNFFLFIEIESFFFNFLNKLNVFGEFNTAKLKK